MKRIIFSIAALLFAEGLFGQETKSQENKKQDQEKTKIENKDSKEYKKKSKRAERVKDLGGSRSTGGTRIKRDRIEENDRSGGKLNNHERSKE